MLRDDREAQRFRIEALERSLADAHRDLDALRAARRPAARRRVLARVVVGLAALVLAGVAVLGAGRAQKTWSAQVEAEAEARLAMERERDRLRDELERTREQLEAERRARLSAAVGQRPPMPAEAYGEIVSPDAWRERDATVVTVRGEGLPLALGQRCRLRVLRTARCYVELSCGLVPVFPAEPEASEVRCDGGGEARRLVSRDGRLVVDVASGTAHYVHGRTQVDWTFTPVD